MTVRTVVQKKARLRDRAFFMWAVGIVASSALAVVESNAPALYVSAVLLLFLPLPVNALVRIASIGALPLVHFFGPILFIAAVPLALAAARRPLQATSAAMGIAAVGFLYPQFQNIPDISGQVLNLGSSGFLIVPALVTALVFSRDLSPARLATLVALLAGIFLVLDVSAAGGWIGAIQLTDPTVRFIVALAPVVAIALGGTFRDESAPAWGMLGFWLLGILLGTTVAVILPSSQVMEVVFDEAHGKWESTQAPFGPDDFGRASNYTYSLLLSHAERLAGKTGLFLHEDDELPPMGTVFVVKMPTTTLSQVFIDRVEAWVRAGGRLLAVADHTDLYDTAQNLNPLLGRFRLRLRADAVYDPAGMPNVPNTPVLGAFLGRIDADGAPFPWQTGASLAAIPSHAVTLASYGLSFSEPGDYARQNRFGPFLPRPSLRFGNHAAVAAASFGKGAVAVVLDSTPWSNFSFFRDVYHKLFQSMLRVLSMPETLMVAGWSGLALVFATAICGLIPGRGAMSVGGLVLGLALGAHAKIGLASLGGMEEGRDYGLRVTAGTSAKLEFLKQLIQPGARNFSRIVSATAKYGLMPSASAPGTEIPDLGAAKRWLLIQPDPNQLPAPQEVVFHLRKGGDLTVLFAPEASVFPEVVDWLSRLGLATEMSIGLAVSEDRRSNEDSLLTRRGATLMRDVRVVTVALPTSVLKEHGGDTLFQTYTSRPTKFPRKSGLLNISFSSDQFSDDAVGDVWEGVEPSSVGRLRERQFASVLEGKEMPFPFSKGLAMAHPEIHPTSLRSYAVLRDGRIVIKGQLNDKSASDQQASPADDISTYLVDLRDRAVTFVTTECKTPVKLSKVTKCEKRLLAPDMVEWMVSWKPSLDGRIAAVELLHERRFSGLGSTWNVLFAE